MDIPKGMAKQKSIFDWQIVQTHPLLHNNNNNKNMIVSDKVLTMTTTIITTQIFINVNNLPATCTQSLWHIYYEMHASVYSFHAKLLKCVF